MYCRACGASVSDAANHCPICGASTHTERLDDKTAQVDSGRADNQRDPLIGRILAGRFRILEKIGQGGMGIVYKGEHISIKRLTAIKILALDLATNQEFVARFRREAEMASNINHPNAVGIYDFGEAEDGLVYLAMEYLDGEPLSEILRQEGPLPIARVVSIIYQAAEALDAAHQMGIIHRDFKPDNVMICQRGSRPDWVKVVDFGLAKRTRMESPQEALTRTGFMLGTPDYMSPEQVLGEELTPRSDLYSLALVAYEMLTCKLPFSGSTPQNQMFKRLIEPPASLLATRPDLPLPAALESVLMKALARDPNDRHLSALEFASELDQAALAGAGARGSSSVTVAQAKPAATTNLTCNRCGATASGEQRFCDVCGTPLSATAVTMPPPVTSPGIAPAYDQVASGFSAPAVASPPATIGLEPDRKKRGRNTAVWIMTLVALIAIGVAVYFATRGTLFPPKVSPSDRVVASLRRAVDYGRLMLFSPDDAYSFYYQLKDLDPNNQALKEIAPSVLPQLRSMGDAIFDQKTAIGADDLTNQDWAKALRIYKWAHDLDPADRTIEARWRFSEGEVAKSENRRDDADRSFYAASQIDPAWALPQNSMGLLRAENKKYSDALQFYMRAIKLQSDWEIPYNNVGTTYFLLKDYDKAEAWYRKALEINPNWSRPYMWLGTLYEQKDMPEKAIEEYQTALNLDPNGKSINVTQIQKRIEELQQKVEQSQQKTEQQQQ